VLVGVYHALGQVNTTQSLIKLKNIAPDRLQTVSTSPPVARATTLKEHGLSTLDRVLMINLTPPASSDGDEVYYSTLEVIGNRHGFFDLVRTGA
jgi:hypothetical protein